MVSRRNSLKYNFGSETDHTKSSFVYPGPLSHLVPKSRTTVNKLTNGFIGKPDHSIVEPYIKRIDVLPPFLWVECTY